MDPDLGTKSRLDCPGQHGCPVYQASPLCHTYLPWISHVVWCNPLAFTLTTTFLSAKKTHGVHLSSESLANWPVHLSPCTLSGSPFKPTSSFRAISNACQWTYNNNYKKQKWHRRRLDWSMAWYIYKAINDKLLFILTLPQKKLKFEQYMQTLFNKNLFKPSYTDTLKILEKELFCSVKGHFKVLWLFDTKTFMSKVVNNF